MKNIEYPWTSEEFYNAWSEWLAYRRERRIKNYGPLGLQRTFTALVRNSNNNEHVAIAMIYQSIEHGWQGIFPLLNKNYGTPGANNGQSADRGTSAARINRAKNW